MVIDKLYVVNNKKDIIDNILNGSIFIYPTDTIYGIGCNALKRESVVKIRQLKQREIKPFSVIAPNHMWIDIHCQIVDDHRDYIHKLPGPYTLFLKQKVGSKLPEEVNPLCNGTLGVRIPDHWFTDIIREAGVPFITTSVNISGAPYMTNIETLDETIKNNVDFIIYEGEINGRESTKIDLTK